MIASGDYARMSEGARKMSPMVEAEVEANAFTHRDVPVMKTTVTAEIDLPTMPSGEQISYSAVAGSYMVTVTAENPEVTKQLIDAALDQKLKRAPLPGGVLMVMEFKLMDLLDKLTPGGNPFAGREQQAPQLVRLTMDTKRGTLNFDVTLR
jgi:hypothetical protein